MATQKAKTQEQRRARRKVQEKKPSGAVCPIRRDTMCFVHGFIHGSEAEELRSGIEKLMAMRTVDDEYGEPAVYASDLQELLDSVDARDSLAFVEAKARARRATETATNEDPKRSKLDR